MIPRPTVILEGRKYVLLYAEAGRVANSWKWVEDGSYDPAAESDVGKLRDEFLAQDPSFVGASATPEDLSRLYQILIAMGGAKDVILGRLGGRVPQSCVDCRRVTRNGYPGPRCPACYEQFVRTARLRNVGNNDVSGGRMGGSRRN